MTEGKKKWREDEDCGRRKKEGKRRAGKKQRTVEEGRKEARRKEGWEKGRYKSFYFLNSRKRPMFFQW